MKKVPVILVVCMLMFSSLDVLAQQNNSNGPGECCFKFFPNRLPVLRVVGFQRTHAYCANNAVVFTMKNGAKLCADPTVKWVENVIAVLESRT